jgi:glycosyltransferase involved in cell wall biosynthesis
MQVKLQQTDLISVGIPFYNAEKYLALAIDSVISQTNKNWELILLDDGSSDNSLQIANEYAERDDRISVVSDGKNKGLGARLNELAALSTGEYIARMDADDSMHPNRLEKQINILETHPEIDVLGTNAYVIDENDLVFGVRFKQQSGLTKVENFIHPTIMAKKQWFIDNPYDEKAIRIEDAELWYRTKKKNDFMIINEPLLFYREFGGEYYKKYFAASKCKNYILSKYYKDRYWEKFFLEHFIKGSIFWMSSKFNFEQKFINRRNAIIFSSKKTVKDLI